MATNISIPPKANFPKAEKLKSRKAIDGLFKGGKSFFIHPYKVFYNVLLDGGAQLTTDSVLIDDSLNRENSHESLIYELLTTNSEFPPTANYQPSTIPTIQAGFAVSTRNFKHAVDRNRIKRLGREAYRLNKHLLITNFEKQAVKLQVFFVFTNKTLPTFVNVQASMQACLRKLVKNIQSPKK